MHAIPKYVRLKQLLAPVGPVPMSRATVWRLAKQGLFPAPIRLSKGITAWDLNEVLDHLASKTRKG